MISLAHADHLTIENLKKIRRACWEARAKWIDIGIELNLKKTDLDAIQDKNNSDQCFTEMLTLWLKQADPLPTQKVLVEALRQPTVNLGQLAGHVERQNLSNLDVSEVVVPRAVSFPDEPEKLTFPHISSEVHDERTRRELELKLNTETKDLISRFNILMSKYFDSLEDQRYPIQRLVRHLKLLLETDHLSLEPKDIDDIMKIIRSNSSFFDYQLIKEMIELSGTDNDKQNLESYQTKFKAYAERRVYECPATISKSNPSDTELHVKLDSKYDKCTLTELQELQGRLYMILNRKVYTIRLLSIENGCFKLTYAIPRYIAKNTFPLSKEQESKLADLGILQLICNDYRFTNTTKV